MTANSENAYFNALNDIVNKYSNTYHKTIKMKPIDVKSDSFTEYNEESNERDPKFKVGNHVRISKYKNIFGKEYAANWSEEIFIIKNHLNGEEIIGSFYEKELQKTNQKEFRTEKLLRPKGKKTICQMERV